MGLPKSNSPPISMKGMHVVMATPCHGDMCQLYVKSLALTIPELINAGIQYSTLHVPNESIIAKARNTIVHGFLKTNGTHLWMIDADMGWRHNQIIRLFASGKDIVAAAGPRKVTPVNYCVLLHEPVKRCPVTTMLAAQAVGTGCIVIARRVLEHMIEQYPDNWYYDYATGEKVYQLFETSIDEHHNFWSEDYTFCRKWTKLGGEIWVDPHIELDHVGPNVWTGSLQQGVMNDRDRYHFREYKS